MDNDIKNLQDLWKTPQSKSMDTNQLISELNKNEKKGKVERIMMLLLFPLTIIGLLVLLPVLENGYFLTSVTIITIAMLMIIFLASY